MNLFESNNSIPDSPSFYWEHLLKEKNYSIIAGVDEAGRGPLSGPVIAAAVIITGEVEFLNELNAKNVKYLGNLKLSNEIHFSEFSNGNDKTLKNKNFWCAVSTHNGEDIFF